MPFAINTYNQDGRTDLGGDILHTLRKMVAQKDHRGAYYIEPTWRINGVPISRCTSPDLFGEIRPTRAAMLSFRHYVSGLQSSELREIIMNACLKDISAHRGVVEMLKHMQKKRPRPLSGGDRVQHPTVGLYLYCRTQKELVDIVLELGRRDETGSFNRDVKDLIMIIRGKDNTKA